MDISWGRRDVIHAVEGAQKMKTCHKAKIRKERDARSLLGQDVRPRTSEPRSLIVTLKRLIRRLRRRCGKLQELLRWEAKFRWHYGKSPPEVAVCSTRSTRKTLLSEQQELRVVLAHLRAMSFDTVKAVSEWRTTFLGSGKPGYRRMHPSESALVRSNGMTRFLESPAEFQEHDHDIGIVYRGDEEGHLQGNKQRHSQREHPGLIDASPEGQQAGLKRRSSAAESMHHHEPHDVRDEDDDNALTRSITVPRPFVGKNDSNPAPVFLWKGHNYLTKLAHDLEFLDDADESAPVSAWLGFSVRDNPFLIPPNGLNVCEDLRRQREERREEAAVRRRQQQQHQRSGGTGNGQRRLSRSRSRSRANSDDDDDDKHRRTSASGDVSAPLPRGQSKQEREQGRDPDSDIKGRDARPKPMVLTPQQQSAPPMADADANDEGRQRKSESATENVVTTSPLLLVTDDQRDGVDGGGGIFVTEGVARSAFSTAAAAEGSLRSASTSVESPLFPPGLGYSDDENTIPHQLSTDEEEELQWAGGGRLDLPIVPKLHESVRSKALAAAQVLRSEAASEQALTSSARAILSNARRTEGILHTPEKDCSFRMESLAERSVREGLRGALVDRHVGATRLKWSPSLLKSSSCVMMGMSPCCREEERPPFVRSVSTAPARGGGRPGLAVICSGAAAARGRAGAARLGHRRALAAFGSRGGGGGSSRGGVRVSVDGHREATDGAIAGAGKGSSDPSRCTQSVPRDGNNTNNRNEKGKRAPLPSSRSQCLESGTGSETSTTRLGGTNEGTADTTAVSAAPPGDRSTTSSSLQASSSTMSARARAKALAVRPTARRRPFCRNGGGRVIIPDPGVSPDVRRRAAARIQAALLALCARRYVRGLRDDRDRAVRLIWRNWRRCRAKADMRTARRLRRAEGLRRVAEERSRNRAAHVVQTFFRDVKYRRERDRHEMSLRGDPGALASQLREETAAIAVQVHVRRLIASKRVRGVRHTRRAQAQARIALAVRHRAARIQQREREQREEQEQRERTGGGDQDVSYYLEMATMRTKPLSLQPDEAATRIQAWRRGVYYRRVAGVAAAQAARRVRTRPFLSPSGAGYARRAS
ncbi:hypothetical protein Esi_0129_0064 [Ectocarpus siliculosus]|uniref:IQ calmodulin-binding motif family protein n=1 Tax=Ectocarpus siliculosus TaxID=2880 RepID=D8LE39_ECTSI|nr:hypothetical protein Esi_0129_0064 [Ectocarpus siliculosus]|eukprot:CBN78556.1 hypothetical protein Esi_0129_0064 [Ectocarpus siliculosus]